MASLVQDLKAGIIPLHYAQRIFSDDELHMAYNFVRISGHCTIQEILNVVTANKNNLSQAAIDLIKMEKLKKLIAQKKQEIIDEANSVD